MAGGEISGPRIYASSAVATPGGEVFISVSLADGPRLAGLVLTLEYDADILSPLEVTQGGLTSEGLFAANISEPGAVRITWLDVDEIEGDGEMFVLRFRALPQARTGAVSPITLSHGTGNVTNLSFEDVHLALVSSAVTIR
jgi:hypothetical protein